MRQVLALISVVVFAVTPASAQVRMAVPRAVVVNTTNQQAWERKDGCAKRIAISEPDHPLVTGCGNDDDTMVYSMNNSGVFEPTGDTASSIAPIPGSLPNAHLSTAGDGAIHLYQPPNLRAASQPAACTKEISTGTSSNSAYWIWALTCAATNPTGDLPIIREFTGDRRLNESNSLYEDAYKSYPGAAVRLATGATDGVTWAISADGQIWRQNYCKGGDPDESLIGFCKSVADGWESIPGCARAISSGGHSQVWIIGCDRDQDGNAAVLQYAGPVEGPIAAARWTLRSGRGKEIAVGKDGRPWIVTADGSIWRWSGAVPARGQRVDTDPPAPTAADPR